LKKIRHLTGRRKKKQSLDRKVTNINSKQGGSMPKFSLLKEFWDFLKVRKKWWLAPIIIMLLLLGALILFTQSSAVAPFIYTLF
jgi:hypothetical protein